MRGPLSIPCLGPALALNARESRSAGLPAGKLPGATSPEARIRKRGPFSGGALPPPPFRERRAHPPPSLGQVASWKALAAGSAVRPPCASSARSVQRPIFPERPAFDAHRLVLRLEVADDDKGKIIGRQGRVAQAMRVLLRVSAVKNDTRAFLEIV